MKLADFIKQLNAIVAAQPEAADFEVVQQDCLSSPQAYTGSSPYIGHYYGTDCGGYLNPDDADEDDPITEDYPAIVIEAF